MRNFQKSKLLSIRS